MLAKQTMRKYNREQIEESKINYLSTSLNISSDIEGVISLFILLQFFS